MKKRILSILLALTLCLSLLPTTALAEDSWADWTKLTSEHSGKTFATADINLYLDDDIEITKTITIDSGITVTLDLNGHGLTMKEGYESDGSTRTTGPVIKVTGNGRLTLKDSTSGGYITGGTGVETTDPAHSSIDLYYGGGVYVEKGGTFTMEGGTIVGNGRMDGQHYGSGVYVVGESAATSTFTMTGGAIIGNAAKCGAGVYVDANGTFTMKNGTATVGTIADNTASSDGGGVYIAGGGTFNMKSGTITGNNAPTGGGVYVGYKDETSGTFTMSGGSITGNNAISSAASGGGVYVNSSGAMSVSGSAQINSNFRGGTKNAGTGVYEKGEGIVNNLCLSNTYITVTDGLSGASIGVTGGNYGTIAKGKTGTGSTGYTLNATDKAAFFSDEAGYTVTLDATRNELTLTAGSSEPTTPTLTGTVTITGDAKFGETLTATVNDSNATSFSYQWKRGDATISGATGNSYTLGEADIGQTITVVVTGTGTTGSISPASATAAVTKAAGPAAPNSASFAATPPTTAGANDGEITISGITGALEYSTDANFTSPAGTEVTGGVIENLAAGTYYVRYKATTTHGASPATTVTVSAPAAGTLTFTNAYDTQRSKSNPTLNDKVGLHAFIEPYTAANGTQSDAGGNWTLTPVGTFGSCTGKPTDDSALSSIVDGIKSAYGLTDANDVPIYQLKLNGTHVTYGVVQAQGKVYDNTNLSGVPTDTNGVLFVGTTLASSTGGTGYFLTKEENLASAESGTYRYMVVGKDAANQETVVVTFDKNCEDASISNPHEMYVVKTTGTISTLPALTRDGHTFDGWYTKDADGNLSSAKVTTATTFSAGTTLYAKWTALTYSIMLKNDPDDTDPLDSVDLGSGTIGYTVDTTSGSVPAQTVDVWNTGTGATGELTVSLTGTNPEAFVLGGLKTGNKLDSINDPSTVNRGAYFTVAPKTGLAVGTYTATVTVTGSNDITASFTVSFTVTALGDLTDSTVFPYAYDAQRNPAFPASGATVSLTLIKNPLDASGSHLSTSSGQWKLTALGTYGEFQTRTGSAPSANLTGVVGNAATAYGIADKTVLPVYELKENGTHIACGVLVAYDRTSGCALFLGDNWNSQGAGYLLSMNPISGTTASITAAQVVSEQVSTYSVAITAGAHMTTTGSATQNVTKTESMTDVTYTAASGYYFPADYAVAAVSGITVTRLSDTQIKVSGTPTANVALTLTDATVQQYTITYTLNGGELATGVTNPTTYTVESAAITLANPTRAGYRFLGWTGSNGDTAQTSVTIPAGSTGHKTYTANWQFIPVVSLPVGNVHVSGSTNGSTAADRDQARQGSIVIITVTPAPGYVVDTVTVTDANGTRVAVTPIGGNRYSFVMPATAVTVRATFTNGTAVGFVDVPANKYFYSAVYWAVASGITSGVDATHFAPYASCTRGQLVTFLWRAAGQPAAKATENPFSDVKEGSAFYKAILWAAENGIVTGYSNGTFQPSAAVSRQQTAAILYRYAKFAKMDVSVGEDTNILSFNDALSVSEYAVSAFQWAVGEQVITGNAGNLLPYDACTRAQIVTMLYRLLAK